MKILQVGVSKQQITGCRMYQQWYRRVGQEVLLMIDETRRSEKTGGYVNIVNYYANLAFLCIDDISYCQKFYGRNRYYIPRLFIKNNKGTAYNEYAVKEWSLTDQGICVTLQP